MAGNEATENPEAIVIHTDGGNPPPFRPVLGGKVPRIRTAKDARKLLGRLISSFTRGEVNSEDARTLAYLCQVYAQVAAPAELIEKLDRIEKMTGGK